MVWGWSDVATETVEAESLAIFPGTSFSFGGVAGVGCGLLPHWQLSPQLQLDSWPLRALQQQGPAAAFLSEVAQQECVAAAFFPAQQQVPARTFSAEQQQPLDCRPALWQHSLLFEQPHEDAGNDCTGTVMAASHINVRAAMLCIVHM